MMPLADIAADPSTPIGNYVVGSAVLVVAFLLSFFFKKWLSDMDKKFDRLENDFAKLADNIQDMIGVKVRVDAIERLVWEVRARCDRDAGNGRHQSGEHSAYRPPGSEG